jgi:predicted ATPase
MENSKFKILTMNELGFISMPANKEFIHVCFNNLMINFTLSDFVIFRSMVKHIYAERGAIVFPDGRHRILLQSPYNGINFSFNPYELNQLVTALDEAYYMEKIYSYLDKD